MYKTIIILLFSVCLSQFSPPFNGETAYNYLLKQCEFGPRYPGSDKHLELKDYLIKFLSDKGDTLIIDEHTIKHPYAKNDINL